MKANNQIVSIVDELGSINDQIKALEARAKELKAHVANEFGEGATAGHDYVAKVILSQRGTLDGKGLAAELGATAEQIQKFTKTTAIITVKTERVVHAA